MAGSFPLEPWIRWSDVSLAGVARWEDVDDVASRWLGRGCVALPSVRVGICWAMEHRRYARHRDHVLVPRFVGRCILSSISRFALPVERPSSETRLAIVVDQFGLRQRLDALSPEFERRGWAFIEDSPYGVGHREGSGPNSLGRFIGLGKALPVAQGALLLTEDRELERFIRGKRQVHSAWSCPVWLTMLALRCRPRVGAYSAVADAAYELYLAAQGGNRWLRGNLVRVLQRAAEFERETRARLDAVAEVIAGRALLPDLQRLAYVVPCFAGLDLAAAQSVFRQFGFDDSAFHVDVARNMLEPRYAKCLLLPLNPRIPRRTFDALLRGLGSVAGRPAPSPHPSVSD